MKIKPKNKLTSTSKQDVMYYQSVVILNAGGTINMSGDDERKPSRAVSKIFKKIKKEMSERGISCTYEEVFDRAPDSSNIGETEWKILFNVVNGIAKRKRGIRVRLEKDGVKLEYGGIVITHGTDTLHTTSLMLSLMMASANLFFPIVFTASHSPMDQVNSDAVNNLRKAIFITKERYTEESNNLPPAIYVLIGQDIHLASRLTKVYTKPNSDGRYFFSYPAPVGQITSKGFHLRLNGQYVEKLLQPTHRLNIQCGCPLQFGIAEHVIIDHRTDIRVVSDLEKRLSFYEAEQPLRSRRIGVIIQGTFIKNPNMESISDLLNQISMRNIQIWVGSREVYTSINKQNKLTANLISKSMSHSKAREKLSWLLGLDIDNDLISRSMSENIAGEIFETEELPEWIKYETYPEQVNGREVLIVYPDIHWKVYDDAVKRLQLIKSTRKKELCIIGFGDGHIPSPNIPISIMVQKYIEEYEILRMNEVELEKHNTIDRLVGYLTHIIQDEYDAVSAFISAYYSINAIQMQKAIFTDIARSRMKKARKSLSRKIKKYSCELAEQYSLKINTAQLKRAIEKALISVHIDVDITELKTEWDMIKSFDSKNDQIKYIVMNYPKYIAQRIIKDGIAYSSIQYRIINEAVDNGIRVRMYTQASRSKTNLSLYENGNMLKYIGVDGDYSTGKVCRYLLPKR
jgi:L-asparaginase/Glu-tRNA(Gln) amidotransferase subunit D